MQSKVLLSLLLMLALALSGCTGGDEDGDDGDSGGSGGSDGGGAGSGGGGAGSGSGGDGGSGNDGSDDEEEVFEQVVLDGTVTGIVDCQALANDQPDLVVGGGTQAIPSDAGGQDFEITSSEVVLDPQQPPTGVASLCVYIDGTNVGSSGSIPEGAAQFELYADGAPQGIDYTITIG